MNFTEAETASNRISIAYEQLETLSSELLSDMARRVAPEWTGEASDAFFSALQRWVDKFDAYNELLKEASTALDGVIARHKETCETIKTDWSS